VLDLGAHRGGTIERDDAAQAPGGDDLPGAQAAEPIDRHRRVGDERAERIAESLRLGIMFQRGILPDAPARKAG